MVYYLLNKPDGVVTTASDPQGRTTVLNLVESSPDIPGRAPRHEHEGSLDTDQRRSARAPAHSPSSGIARSTWPGSRGTPRPRRFAAARRSRLDDGLTSPAPVSTGERRAAAHRHPRGRTARVRRMCSAVGHDVTRLVRTRIGPLQDATLSPGPHAKLSISEVRRLMEAVGMTDEIASTMPS